MIMSDKNAQTLFLHLKKAGEKKTKNKERVVFMNVFVHVPIC
jgi:hypothetical protein